jgi:hypothetical protein
VGFLIVQIAPKTRIRFNTYMKKILEGMRQGGFVSKIGSLTTSPKFIISLAIVIILSTFGVWQYHNATDPDRIFWGMVNENMQTSSYSRHTYQKSGAQSVDQIFQTATSPQNIVFSKTVFTQTGVDSATAVTENIGTPTADYVRYTSVDTADKQDFSNVIGLWGETANESGQTQGQVYNQSVLGVVPIGNLTSSQRRELIKIMHDKGAYEYRIVETTHSLPFYRPTHKMSVTVNPVGYITALKQYAQYVGLNHLQDVNPEEYAKAAKLSFTVSVDGWTHQMTQINQGSGGKSEFISGQNLRKKLPGVPKDAISVDELQTKLQLVQ